MLVVQHIFLYAGIVFVMIQCREVVLYGGSCLSCGGKGKHRDDCPLRDEN